MSKTRFHRWFLSQYRQAPLPENEYETLKQVELDARCRANSLRNKLDVENWLRDCYAAALAGYNLRTGLKKKKT